MIIIITFITKEKKIQTQKERYKEQKKTRERFENLSSLRTKGVILKNATGSHHHSV
jgi:hypothetical protein